MYRTTTMTARFPGTCTGCHQAIAVGDVIVHIRKGTTYHQDCDGATLVTRTYFPSTGATVYRNAKGTCEDAPACGCCTF